METKKDEVDFSGYFGGKKPEATSSNATGENPQAVFIDEKPKVKFRLNKKIVALIAVLLILVLGEAYLYWSSRPPKPAPKSTKPTQVKTTTSNKNSNLNTNRSNLNTNQKTK